MLLACKARVNMDAELLKFHKPSVAEIPPSHQYRIFCKSSIVLVSKRLNFTIQSAALSLALQSDRLDSTANGIRIMK